MQLAPRRTFGFILEKFGDLGHSTIESADGKAMICHVQYQILAHDGQTDETEVSTECVLHMSASVHTAVKHTAMKQIFENALGQRNWKKFCELRSDTSSMSVH